MRIRLRNPTRQLDVAGPKKVRRILEELEINPETVIVIRGDTLLLKDDEVGEDDEIELRPVISGGAGRSADAGTAR